MCLVFSLLYESKLLPLDSSVLEIPCATGYGPSALEISQKYLHVASHVHAKFQLYLLSTSLSASQSLFCTLRSCRIETNHCHVTQRPRSSLQSKSQRDRCSIAPTAPLILFGSRSNFATLLVLCRATRTPIYRPIVKHLAANFAQFNLNHHVSLPHQHPRDQTPTCRVSTA